MPTISLVTPTPAHKAQMLALSQAFQDRQLKLHGAISLEMFDTYEEWLAFSQAPAGTVAPNNAFIKVADQTFFGVSEDNLLGVINIRHELNDYLLKFSGHIGYSVHPEYWGQGIASQMLEQALAYCRGRQMQKVLITCNDTNLASAKVIEKHGGVLENKVHNDQTLMRRYWITL